MKKKLLKINVIIILLMGFSCGTANMRVEVLRPAYVTIPQKIKTIALINHTIPIDKVWDIIEGILTGEMIDQDKKGKEQALQGLTDRMGQSTRFKIINTAEVFEAQGSISGKTFPTPLSWSKISSLCRKYKADAVLSLENYDSDFIITRASKQITEEGRTVTEYIAKGVATINIGFRIYDPSQKSIIDEESFTFNNNWSAKGRSPGDAIRHLISRGNAVNKVSRNAGVRYAERITPLYTWVGRMYYKKGKKNKNIGVGARQGEIGEWEKAAKTWENCLNSGHKKDPGRAAYNLALAYEMQGDLETALEWAKKSYTKYGNDNAQQYVRVLENRINDQKRLQEQLGN